MLKNAKNKLLAFAGAVMVGSFALSVGTLCETVDAYEYTTKLFAGHGVTVKTEQTLGNETGMLLFSERSGSFAEYKDEISGELTVCFELPKDDFGDTFSFTFSDKDSGEKFAVKLVTGEKEDHYFVSANGKNAGIYYTSTGESGGHTAAMNADGYYTKITRNVKNTFSFNPNTMCLYVNDKLIWNLLSSDNDGSSLGKTYGGFSSYNFGIGFEDVKSQPARILIDSICGQSVGDKYLMVDDGSPIIYADLKINALKGEDYKIPLPKAYDVSDGRLPAENVRVSVADSKGKTLLNAAWTENSSFTPEKGGGEKYKITYEVSDKSGNVGQVSFTVKSFSEPPADNFNYFGKFVNETIGVNGVVELPSASLASELIIENTVLVPSVAVYKIDGETRKEISRAEASQFSFTLFPEKGVYEVVYEKEYCGVKFSKIAQVITVSEDVAGFSYAHFDEKYFLGSSAVIPVCTVSFGGKTTESRAMIICPDGSTYTTSELDLNQIGVYSVIYQAVIDGVKYSKTYTFTVTKNENDIFGKGIVESKIGAYPYDAEITGLNVRLKAQTPAVYSELIDFSAWNATDTLIELLAVSPIQNSVVYNKIIVTLRDSKDYSKYITILANGKNNTSSTELTLKTNGYKYGAATGSGSYSNSVAHSFTSAAITGRKTADNTISIRYDYKNGVFYAKQADGSYAVFADFKNEKFTSVAGTFNGFTDDKAILEISFEYRDRATLAWWDQAYLLRGADVMILKMAGYDFTNGTITDSAAPEIVVDAPQVLPKAVAGIPYKLFDAKAFDKIDGSTTPNVRVVYNYGSEQYVDVKITDGKFIPTYAGEYSIVYSATDKAGNVSETVKKVTAYSRNFNDFNATLTDDGITSFYQGEKIVLRTCTAHGGSGGIYEIVAAVYDENGLTVDIENNSFKALTTGNYTVNYRIKDYVENTTSLTYSIEVKEQPLPQIETEGVSVQPIMTAGQTHKLPKYVATDYASEEPAELEAQIYVRYAGGDFEKIADPSAFVVDENRVNHGDLLDFEYRFTGSKATAVHGAQTKIAKLVTESGNINFKDYFVYSETVGELTGNYVLFKTVGKGSALFGKKLLANGLNFSFNTADDNLNALLIRLYDSEDPRISVLLSVARAANNTYAFSVNGGAATSMAAATANRLLDFSYNDNGKRAFVTTNISSSTGNSFAADINATESGEPFNGFLSGFVTAELFFESKTLEGTSVILYSISGQSVGGVKDKETGAITGTTRDYVGPKINVNGEYMGSIREGESFTIPSAIACDVAGFVSDVTVSVSAPNGGYVTAEDGTLLKFAPADRHYVISPKTAGRYGVRYDCSDSNNNVASFTTRPLYVNSRGSEGDITYTLSGKIPKTGKVDETVTLPTCTAENGVTVSVAVFDPYDAIIAVSNSGAFVPKQKGKYLIRYVFYDLSGRIAVEEHELVVD